MPRIGQRHLRRAAGSAEMAYRATPSRHSGCVISTIMRLISRRAKRNLLSRFNLICPVQSPCSKIFRFAATPNHFYIRRRPVPLEGRLAIVTDAGRDAVDADAPLTNGA